MIVVKKGPSHIPGLTDVKEPRRLGPKRANKIRKLYNADSGANVCKLVIRRAISKEGSNIVRFKAPKV